MPRRWQCHLRLTGTYVVGPPVSLGVRSLLVCRAVRAFLYRTSTMCSRLDLKQQADQLATIHFCHRKLTMYKKPTLSSRVLSAPQTRHTRRLLYKPFRPL